MKPAAHAERSLILAILNGDYPPGSILPAERELAARLGITRPTLRESLQRLGRDGWLTIQQGKPTRVNDYWKEGGLNVLNALVHYSEKLPVAFIPNLLQVRLVLAPTYTRQAVEHNPSLVAEFLQDSNSLNDLPEEYASFDWHLHCTLTIASGNPIFTLILNGFAGFYEQMAAGYFRQAKARQVSLDFYQALRQAVTQNDAGLAEKITREVMQQSILLWETRPGEKP
ncbi:MAG TPA: fatty acid metabolism transcriptional regulator FadR [Anaerolineales bacterium]